MWNVCLLYHSFCFLLLNLVNLVNLVPLYFTASVYAASQANDVRGILAGPLKCRLAGLICILHPTGCTTGCVHTAGCTL